MTDESIVYIKVVGLGQLMSDNLFGYNDSKKKHYKMALHNGKYWVVESDNRNGPWKLKNGDNIPLQPTRIVNYTKEEVNA